MRTTIAIALVVLVAVAAASDYKSMFESFKSQHARKYESAEEEGKRFDIFVENMKKAEKMNQGNPLARFGANEFADMSAAEFKTRHNADELYAKLAKKAGNPEATFTAEQIKAVSQKDWRKEGAVTGVKNQGQCGSCWSFSTTGGIEGQWFLAGNKLTSLSEQLFVSCDTIDHGCQGGLMDNAFNWVISDNKGDLVTEASYPYVSGGGQVPPCQKQGKTFGAKIIGHQDIAHNEDQMAAFVGTGGPLSIAVDASSWQTYMGGIMTNCASTQLDHGVLIVGYDKTNSPPYWIVKNSWGPGWGESGYIRIEYGTNQCLINNYPTTSKVAKGPNPGPGPQPPSPPTPNGASFEQKTCTDDKCAQCKTETLPQGKCIAGTSSSFVAQCISDGLLVRNYQGTSCTGSYTEVVNPVDVCQVVFNADKPSEFVLNSCKSGPAPGPGPQPPSPPAPTNPPAPTGGLTQKQCTSSTCTSGCQQHTFPLNVCLRLEGGGSAKVTKCESSGLTMEAYPLSADCSGLSEVSNQPVNQCVKDESGTYLENECSSSVSAVQGKTLRKQ